MTMTNAEIALWYLAIGSFVVLLTDRYPTPGERIGGILQVAGGAFFVGVLLPPAWNQAMAVFVPPAGRVLGMGIGKAIDRLRLYRARREVSVKSN